MVRYPGAIRSGSHRIHRFHGIHAALLLVLCASGGCGMLMPRLPPLIDAPLELTETPFFAQQDYHCGPAALATILVDGGVDTDPDRLASALYIPDLRGTLQFELQAATRRAGRLPVRVDPTDAALIAQLRAGRPVLVLQNLALRALPAWHYAVVVGYQPEPERWILRSGTERRDLQRRQRFDATWDRGGRWALVVLDPAEPPTGLAAAAYLRAAADLEATGHHANALQAFRTAAASWPQLDTALLGIANNLYHLQHLDDAETAYRQVLDAFPDQTLALFNLVTLLVQRDRGCDALTLLDAAADADVAADGTIVAGGRTGIPPGPLQPEAWEGLRARAAAGCSNG